MAFSGRALFSGLVCKACSSMALWSFEGASGQKKSNAFSSCSRRALWDAEWSIMTKNDNC